MREKAFRGASATATPTPNGTPEPSGARRGGGFHGKQTASGHNPNGAPEPSGARRGRSYTFLNSLIASFHSFTSLFIALMMYPFIFELFLTALLAMV